MTELSKELNDLEASANEKAEAFATSEKWAKLTNGQKNLLALLVDAGQYANIEDAVYQLRTSVQWVHRHALGLSALGLARRELSSGQIWLAGA